MADGAELVINGEMSLSAKHFVAHAGYQHGCAPGGALSFVQMQGDSKITVNDGGALYAYGYVTGSGKVEIKSGAVVGGSIGAGPLTVVGKGVTINEGVCVPQGEVVTEDR
jgi:hypothetical protein